MTPAARPMTPSAHVPDEADDARTIVGVDVAKYRAPAPTPAAPAGPKPYVPDADDDGRTITGIDPSKLRAAIAGAAPAAAPATPGAAPQQEVVRRAAEVARANFFIRLRRVDKPAEGKTFEGIATIAIGDGLKGDALSLEKADAPKELAHVAFKNGAFEVTPLAGVALAVGGKPASGSVKIRTGEEISIGGARVRVDLMYPEPAPPSAGGGGIPPALIVAGLGVALVIVALLVIIIVLLVKHH